MLNRFKKYWNPVLILSKLLEGNTCKKTYLVFEFTINRTWPNRCCVGVKLSFFTPNILKESMNNLTWANKSNCQQSLEFIMRLLIFLSISNRKGRLLLHCWKYFFSFCLRFFKQLKDYRHSDITQLLNFIMH